MNEREEGPLLQLIPPDRLSSRQGTFLYDTAFPMYNMLREPTHFDEFDFDQYPRIAIWRENGTVICICKDYFKPPWDRNVFFMIDDEGKPTIVCTIYGETDAAIAETATFFWSLKHPDDVGVALQICYYGSRWNGSFSEPVFDYASFQSDQLAQVLDANPTRLVCFAAGHFSSEQTNVLASRPHPLNLKVCGGEFAFEDDGTAFIDALEQRQSSFGSLHIVYRDEGTPFSPATLQRLFNLEVFEKIWSVVLGEESALLPFSAKVDVLDYQLIAGHVQPEDFHSLDIRTKDLRLAILLGFDDEWDAIFISLLNRVATLGHFERLTLSIKYIWGEEDDEEDFESFEFDDVAPVAEALIGAIRANPNLSCLDLSGTDTHLHWGPHLQGVFEAMEEHEGLRTFMVQSYAPDDDWNHEQSENEGEEFRNQFEFDPSWLKQLISRNRNITVLDKSGDKCTDGSTIDKAYALNVFFKGSASLVKEANMSLRPLLVATAMGESASNAQYMALLLSQHTDILCEFIHGVNLEASSPVSMPHSGAFTAKRKIMRVQPPRAAKKAAYERK